MALSYTAFQKAARTRSKLARVLKQAQWKMSED
jgi:hypothetical protein